MISISNAIQEDKEHLINFFSHYKIEEAKITNLFSDSANELFFVLDLTS